MIITVFVFSYARVDLARALVYDTCFFSPVHVIIFHRETFSLAEISVGFVLLSSLLQASVWVTSFWAYLCINTYTTYENLQ